MLSNLLSLLQNQVTENRFIYSVVVVDNDIHESARDIVESWEKKSTIQISYFCQPEQNIALARNMAIENVKGNLVAFIDDDEFPINEWLINLFDAYIRYRCAGVLGPVKPYYPDNTPKWLIKSRVCERPSYKSGTILDWLHMRTGNVLFGLEILVDNKPFCSEFGKTGGEDQHFFRRMISMGRVFVWCDEAIAYEAVLPERWSKSFHLKKHVQMGGTAGESAQNEPFIHRCIWITKTFISMSVYGFFMPFSILGGQHVFMNCSFKFLYFMSAIIGFLWKPIIRFRYNT